LIFIAIYLVALIIAPQLWIEPFKGIRTDLYIYPAWMAYLVLSGKLKNFEFTETDKYFALMVVWIVITTFVNEQNARSMEIIQNYVKWFVLFKLISMTVIDSAGVRKTAKVLIILGIVMSIEGIQHKLSPDGIGWAGQSLGWVDPSVLKAGGTGRTEWINIFDGPGVFCVIYTMVLPFVLAYLGKPYKTLVRIIAFGVVALLLLATFYTGSRGGFLATLAVFGFFLANKFKISAMRVATIGGILFVAFMLAPAYLTSLKDSNRSAQHRVDMWMEGVEMVQQNPVFGIGKGNFAIYTGRLIAHNSSIEIMGELGLPGFFFWLALIYASLKSLFKAYAESEDEQERSIILGLGISIAGYLMSSMFVTLEYETFYFLLALCAPYVKRVTGVATNQSRVTILVTKDYYRIFGIMIGWIILLKIFFRLYY